MRERSGSPSTSSLTVYSTPASLPTSKRATMLGVIEAGDGLGFAFEAGRGGWGRRRHRREEFLRRLRD